MASIFVKGVGFIRKGEGKGGRGEGGNGEASRVEEGKEKEGKRREENEGERTAWGEMLSVYALSSMITRQDR